MTSIRANRSPIKLDIMVGEHYYKTIAMPVMVGVKYDYRELEAFARLTLPSLENKQFNVLPAGRPVFR